MTARSVKEYARLRALAALPTDKELRALGWAIGEASAWRGSMVANPDTTQLDAFDAYVKVARRGLRKVRLIVKSTKGMLS